MIFWKSGPRFKLWLNHIWWFLTWFGRLWFDLDLIWIIIIWFVSWTNHNLNSIGRSESNFERNVLRPSLIAISLSANQNDMLKTRTEQRLSTFSVIISLFSRNLVPHVFSTGNFYNKSVCRLWRECILCQSTHKKLDVVLFLCCISLLYNNNCYYCLK